MIPATVTLRSGRSDLQGLRDLVDLARRLGAPPSAPLAVDPGGPAYPEGALVCAAGDLSSLEEFLAANEDLPGDQLVVDAATAALLLPVYGVDVIGCGEHVGATPDNLLVTVNEGCRGCVSG